MGIAVVARFSVCVASLLASSAFAADYNGDGFADLAVGNRLDPINGITAAGSVTILYGEATAFATINAQTLSQASFGALTSPAASDRFGSTIGSGDFNGDGFDDIAITSYGETVSNKQYAGTVLVAYGSALGIQTSTARVFHQNTPGVKDKVEKNPTLAGAAAESFGTALAAGDFDGDGFDDLAIGVHEALGSKQNPKVSAGAVHVLRGSANGLKTKGNQFFTQNTPGIDDAAATKRFFGYALAAGDLDGDGIDDLAIGAVDSEGNDGSVTILRGKLDKGLTGKNSVVMHESAVGGNPNLVFGNEFGNALAIGDFKGSGSNQLVIGAHTSFAGATAFCGAVFVITFSQPTLAVVESQRLARDVSGINGSVQANAFFGAALAVGDLNDDGFDDLVVSSPSDTITGIANGGSLNVFPGSSTGLTIDDHFVTQDTNQVPGIVEFGDQFGNALAVGDFDNDGDADLAVGIHGQAVGGADFAGALLIIEGSTSSLLDYSASRAIDKSNPSIDGDPVADTYFASALGG